MSEMRPILVLFLLCVQAYGVRIATFNVRNYLSCGRMVENKFQRNYPKPEKEKAFVQEAILAIKPDILAIQEMGGRSYLEELQSDLEKKGLLYPYLVVCEGVDKVRHTAILSKMPFDAKNHQLNFKYFNKKRELKRGLLEGRFRIGQKDIVLYVVHLKSHLGGGNLDKDSAQFRLNEARTIRNFLRKKKQVILLGDFNDTKDTSTLKSFLKIGEKPLFHMLPNSDSNGEHWTYYYSKADSYSRTDFILFSKDLIDFVKGEKQTHIYASCLEGSDHRLVYVDLNI